MKTAKFAICLGSFLAFSITFFNGMSRGSDMILVLRDAAIACLVAALICRFFVEIIVNSIREAHLAQMEAASEPTKEQEAPAPKPHPSEARETAAPAQ